MDIEESMAVASSSTSNLPTTTTTSSSICDSSLDDLRETEPRTIRVPRPSRASVLTLTTAKTNSITVSPGPSSPPLPARSPLRPPARSISSTYSINSRISTISTGSIPLDTTNTANDGNDVNSPSSLLSSPSSITPSDWDDQAPPQTPSDFANEMISPTNAMGEKYNRDRQGSFPSLSSLMDQVREEFGLQENEEDATLPLRVKPSTLPPLESLRGGSFTVTQSRDSEEVKENVNSMPLTQKMERDGGRYMEDGSKRDRDSSSSTINSVASSSFGALMESTLTSGAASTMSTPASSVASHEPQESDTSITTATVPTARMTKRDHAMHELLSSERAYASDLALIREVHIPLALGQTVPLPHNVLRPTPVSTFTGSGPSSSSSSARARESSDSLTPTQPPMTPEDAKIIFSNVSELAIFSDMFTEELELALGDIVEGGIGYDCVGALFLRIIPELEKPYKMYITRHPTALQHLQALPQTPALQSYLAYTQSIASSVSHAWDLASLLIKPVQRLLKYPLLLGAIIDETPDSHPDKDNLKSARTQIEVIARNVNEGRRRAEVVKDVLASKSPKKPSAPVGVAASVNLSKVKSLRHGGVTAATMRVAQLTEVNGNPSEAAQVAAMETELKRIELFAQQFAKNVVDWGKMMANVMLALRGWALSFGKVIGLSADQHSEAFEAFLAVVTQGLLPLTVDLDSAINEHLLKDMAHLLMTMNQPLKLLASMAEQEPYHYHLLTMPVSAKNRPPPALLEASTNYLALRGQLAAELPAYLGLLHKGCAVFVRRLAGIQTRFWLDVKERWAELWEMLRVEGELNAGVEETCNVWCARWADVDEVVRQLNIANPVPPLVPVFAQAQAQAQAQAYLGKGYATLQAQHVQMLEKEEERERLAALGKRHDAYFSYPEFYTPMAPQLSMPKERDRERFEREQREREKKEQKEREKEQRERDKQAAKNKQVNVAAISSMFAALEPAHSPVHRKQSNATSISSTLGSTGSGSSMYGGTSTPMYAVSGPMPLGSMASLSHSREGKEVSNKKSRGRGISDASNMTTQSRTSGNSSGAVLTRRPSSQDSSRHRPDTQSALGRRRTQGQGLSDDFEEYMKMSGVMMPPSYDGGHYTHSNPSDGHTNDLNRRKSMPLSPRRGGTDQVTPPTRAVGHGGQLPSGAGYVVNGDHLYYHAPVDEHEQYQPYQETSPPRQRDTGRDRGRLSHPKSQTPLPVSSSSKPKSKERQTHSRKRSGSTKSITSFFTGGSSDRNSNPSPPDPQPLTPSQRDSWVSKPAKYTCQVVHPCRPPTAVQYYSFPFFTLQVGDFYEVLQEAGHPSIHPKLPLYVDDGEDCLLLCRNGNGIVGWALASFLEPVNMEG